MSQGYFIPRGECLAVDYDDVSRAQAIQRLVRPREVAYLWHGGSRSAAEPPVEVASWLMWMLETGQLRYSEDPAEMDRWCSPAVTLNQGKGDCDDLAILAASLLRAARQPAWVMIGTIRERGRTTGHAWVEGEFADGAPYLLEPTTGELLDRRPSKYQATLAANERGIRRVVKPSTHTDWKVIVGAIAAGAAVGYAIGRASGAK
jgi:transglutaminase-like putative cysteine protease